MKQKTGRLRLPWLWTGLCLLLGGLTIQAQQNFTISGNVTDKIDGETLFGTSIFL